MPSGLKLMLGICSWSVPVLHKTLFVPVLMYGSKTLLWKYKERSRIRAIETDNLKGLLGIRRMDRVQNAWIREFCGVKKGIDEGVLQWFSHVENDRIAKSLCKKVCW